MECLLLVAEHLDDFLSGHHLFDIAVDSGEALLLGAEMAAGALAELTGGKQHDGCHEEADEGEGDAEYDHRREGGDDGDEG